MNITISDSQSQAVNFDTFIKLFISKKTGLSTDIIKHYISLSTNLKADSGISLGKIAISVYDACKIAYTIRAIISPKNNKPDAYYKELLEACKNIKNICSKNTADYITDYYFIQSGDFASTKYISLRNFDSLKAGKKAYCFIEHPRALQPILYEIRRDKNSDLKVLLNNSNISFIDRILFSTDIAYFYLKDKDTLYLTKESLESNPIVIPIYVLYYE